MFEKIKRYLVWFLILVYVCGAFGFAMQPSFFGAFTPLTLLLTSLVFLVYQPWKEITYLSSFFMITCIGFCIEVIGVKTGFVFGEYYYGQALGYKLLGVPIVISLNWALLISAGVLFGTFISQKKMVASLLSASIITGIDFLIEQVCTQMDLWYFKKGLAGLHNFLAWFVISFICSFIFYKTLSKGNKRIAILILFLQIFFFGVTFIFKLL